MSDGFDSLAKSLAAGMTRRQALRRFAALAAGFVGSSALGGAKPVFAEAQNLCCEYTCPSGYVYRQCRHAADCMPEVTIRTSMTGPTAEKCPNTSSSPSTCSGALAGC